MNLTRVRAFHYRSLRDVDVTYGALNVFIGANASGKSNILDTLRFLSSAVKEKAFEEPVRQRGGMLQLAWKGESATVVKLMAELRSEDQTFVWNVEITFSPAMRSSGTDLFIERPASRVPQ